MSRGCPRGYPRGRPGAKATVGPSKSWENMHFGADIMTRKWTEIKLFGVGRAGGLSGWGGLGVVREKEITTIKIHASPIVKNTC